MSIREKRGVCKLIFEIYVILFWQWGKPSMHTRIESQNQSVFANGFPLSRYMYQPMFSSAAAANSILHSCLCLCMPSCISKDLCQASSVLIILIYPRSRTSTTTTVADFQLPCVLSFMLFQYPQTTQARVTQKSSRILCYFRCCIRWRWLWCLFFCFFLILSYHMFFYLMAHETKREERWENI